jgi:hypothetical protein
MRGAEDASHFEEIDYLGFPLSLSETFQQRNTNKSISEALELWKKSRISVKSKEKLWSLT